MIRPASVRFVFSYVNTFTQWGCSCSECSSVYIMKNSLGQQVFIYDNFVKQESWRRDVNNFRHKIGAILENELRRVIGHVFTRCAVCHIAQVHHFKHELWIWYIHHYAIPTAKVQNKSSACSSVMYESAAISSVRSLARDGSPGTINGRRHRSDTYLASRWVH